LAEWLRSGLQSRLHRFDSGRRLSNRVYERRSGKLVAIVLFETEDDLRQGDATLNEMSPSEDLGSVTRRSVEMFGVAVHERV
jgi:hypothetical protein